jgi:DNA-binding transcriptional MerR regulator
VRLKSNDVVALIPIGEAADRLGLRPSALRYYDERGLVSPSQRVSGRRMYGADELRRLAFIKVAQRLGLPLSTAAAVLDAPGPYWRQTVRQQIVELDQVIAQAQAAQMFLTHALHCPSDHPARECATMIATLDRLVDGTTVEQLVAEHQRGESASEPREPSGIDSSLMARRVSHSAADREDLLRTEAEGVAASRQPGRIITGGGPHTARVGPTP